MEQQELNEIVDLHKLWIEDNSQGKRANLSNEDLRNLNLSYANLNGVNLEGANLSHANLSEADLSFANLSETDLSFADLKKADLFGVYLKEADLGNANLEKATLSFANLEKVNLYGANLIGANLKGTYLFKANLSFAKLPAWEMLLKADWDKVSDKLCVELMRYDASLHPKGVQLFNEWVKGGVYSYKNRPFKRAINFYEELELWSPGSAKSAKELIQLLFQEKRIQFNFEDDYKITSEGFLTSENNWKNGLTLL